MFFVSRDELQQERQKAKQQGLNATNKIHAQVSFSSGRGSHLF